MLYISKVSFLPPIPCAVVCFTPVIWEDFLLRWWEGGSSPPWSPATELHIYGQTSYCIPVGSPIPVGCCHVISPFVQHSQPQRQAPLPFLKIILGLEFNDNIGLSCPKLLISVVLSTKLMAPDHMCWDCWCLGQVRGRFPHCFPALQISTALKAVPIHSAVSWASPRILERKPTLYN